MKYILLSLTILKKQKILNILLILEIVLTLIMLNVLLNRIDEANKYYNAVHSSNVNNSIYYMGKSFDEDYASLEPMFNYLTLNSHYLGMSDLEDYLFESQNIEYTITSYDELTSNKFKSPIRDGKWFTDVDTGDNIPCVVLDNSRFPNSFKTSQVLIGDIMYFDYEIDSYIRFGEKTIEITGIIGKNDFGLLYPKVEIANHILPIESLYPALTDNSITFLCGTIDTSLPRDKDSRGILYFDNNISRSEINDIAEEVSKFGYNNIIYQMLDRNKELLKYRIKSDLPMFISFLTIGFIGLISVTLLNTKKQLRNFSIYYLVGCNWIKSVLIYMIYLLLLLGISFILFTIAMNIFYYLDERDAYNLYLLTFKNFTISGAICLSIATISTIIPFLNSRKYSPISLFKKN